MKGFLRATTVLMLLLTSTANAGSWFQPCETALTTPPFRKLNDFYLTHSEEHKPELCFRLNDREFLVTLDDTGRVLQGLYYFNATDGTYAFPDGYYRANLSVPLEFDGPNKKHFALLLTNNLHGGVWDAVYEVLYLKPKKEGKAFELEELFYVNQDPGVGMCGERVLNGVAANVDSVNVENERTAKTTLVFKLTEQSCPDGDTHSVQRRFAWQSNHFVEQKQ
ncbi:hypothetical protein [Pseudomonas sp. SCB32]|uniref:hypothetical protein n=1 Tax=Pseudomonas sp. SCB32 TaxID=2653853 RepID=UPI00126468EF|nr:hypothetical protein [Pseudomonas sp. SCB32]